MNAMNAAQIQNLIRAQQQPGNGLLSFKAGRMTMNESTRIVTALNIRGKIVIDRDDMGFYKFQWLNRANNQKGLDLMLVVGTMEWKRVDDCKDGRVYVLIDKSSKSKNFFWLQEPKEDKDEELCKKVNMACNGLDPSKDPPKTEEKKDGGNQEAKAPTNANYFLEQAMMDALGLGNQPPAAQQPELIPGPDLTDVLDTEAIMKMFEDKEVCDALTPLLPEEMRSKDEVRAHLEGPQFKATCRRLQAIINSPEMAGLMTQMGLQPSANNQIGIKAFLDAIQKKADSENEKP